jgi:hypothetical protein
MRTMCVLLTASLVGLNSCIEMGPDDTVVGEYFLEKVNGQQLSDWQPLRVESAHGVLEILRGGSIKLRSGGSFDQAHWYVERTTNGAPLVVERKGSGTYRALAGDTFEFTGGLGGTVIGVVSRGKGTIDRVLLLDRRPYDGVTFTYHKLKETNFF